MKYDVRSRESDIISMLYPDESLLNFNTLRAKDFHIEGGDVLVFRENHLIVGISQRTSPKAIDHLAKQLKKDKLVIYGVQLPKERYCIHLDMVFTFADHNTAVIFEPLFLGGSKAPVVEAIYERGKTTRFNQYPGLLEAFKANEIDMSYISCGGQSSSQQLREQWLSGANVFCLAPGIVVGYSCNTATIQAFEEAGYTRYKAQDVIQSTQRRKKPFSAEDYFAENKVFISVDGIDLARGGGGIRCMTMPLTRADIN